MFRHIACNFDRCASLVVPSSRPSSRTGSDLQLAGGTGLPRQAGESHLANKRLFCCGKSILGVLR
ncbi:hypothetical protein CN216_06985 [Sinorhizobium meliloti]|nr:hypothetical protein CN216_06985 [Sinorhizobium meliloti]